MCHEVRKTHSVQVIRIVFRNLIRHLLQEVDSDKSELEQALKETQEELQDVKEELQDANTELHDVKAKLEKIRQSCFPS